MHWTAKKLLHWYYTLRGDDCPPDGVVGYDEDGEEALPTEPELAIQEEHLRCSKIDPDAFDFFYVHYYHRILRFCYGRTRRRDMAEDLTAETFCLALERIGDFKWSGVSFGAWLYRIAANEIKKWYKLNTRRRETALPGNVLGEDILVGDEPDPERRYELTQERERLARYMARLHPDEQIFLELRFREGLSTREIAVIADRKWGTVAARINRSLLKLQRMAEEDDEGGRQDGAEA